jgi:hypothetical protein
LSPPSPRWHDRAADVRVEAADAVAGRPNAAWNNHGLDAALEMISDACVFDATSPAPDGERFTGKPAIRASWKPIFDDPSSHFAAKEPFTAGPARDVARRDHQREPERQLAVGVGQQLDQRQPDGDRLARDGVADPHGEYVRPVLFGDRCPPALRDRLVVIVSSTLDDVPVISARTSTTSSGRLPRLIASAPRPPPGSAACPASSGAMSAIMSSSLYSRRVTRAGGTQAAVGQFLSSGRAVFTIPVTSSGPGARSAPSSSSTGLRRQKPQAEAGLVEQDHVAVERQPPGYGHELPVPPDRSLTT